MMERCKAVSKSDNVLRINYLYQAAHSALMCHPANPSIARFYLQTLIRVRQKNQVRLDPSIKRTLCKKCNMLLIMGLTATTRHTDNGRKHVVVTCLDCGFKKRYRRDNPGYRLWSERPEAWVVQPEGTIRDFAAKCDEANSVEHNNSSSMEKDLRANVMEG